ncbi:hypothetical protein [Sphingomonas sp. M1A8_2b]
MLEPSVSVRYSPAAVVDCAGSPAGGPGSRSAAALCASVSVVLNNRSTR